LRSNLQGFCVTILAKLFIIYFMNQKAVNAELDVKFKERLAKLNEAQRKAVETIFGPVLVVAGPGSGKTELLGMRVANILKTTDTLASSILCLTFTDSAAKNMRKRLVEIIGDEAYKVAIHTFHSFGTEIIMQNPEFFYDGAMFKAADNLMQIQLMEELFSKMKFDNPLNKYHPKQGYTYIRDVQTLMSDFKKGGLSSEGLHELLVSNRKYLEPANEIVISFMAEAGSIRSVKKLSVVEQFLADLQAIEAGKGVHGFEGIKEKLVGSLYEAYNECLETESTKPYTAWKKQWIRKDKQKNSVLKDFLSLEKLEAMAVVYERYQVLLHERGFIDFNDMLLQVVEVFKNHPVLKFNLQEKYQFVLVDEFQDTSGVQMEMIYGLMDATVNEGKPNIMAVGDDDQSIYKFQGANLSNIINFHKVYKETKIVVLQNNYRSTQPILDLIRQIILKGDERLENVLDYISKELVSSNTSLKDGEVVTQEFATELEEQLWIVKKIKALLEEGVSLADIAVIGRNHRQLEFISKLFMHFEVPIEYERNRDVLKERHIQELLVMCKFINSLNRANLRMSDELLPEILSYKFWGISSVDIWKISIQAYKNRKTWLEVMLDYPLEKIQEIAKFFIELAQLRENVSAESFLDFLIGNESVVSFTEKSEKNGEVVELDPKLEIIVSENSSVGGESPSTKELEKGFFSGFKAYYFDKLNENYLDYLASLTVFVQAVRGFGGDEVIKLKDLVEFIELHEKHKVSLNEKSVFQLNDEAVSLLTAHKAKGLEFDRVFVLSCQDDIWGKTRNMKKISLPANLPLSAEGDIEDDMIRLFYVALSRAKRFLYLSSYKYKVNGKESLQLRFLDVAESDSRDGEKSSLKKIPAQEAQKMNQDLITKEGLEEALELEVFGLKSGGFEIDETALLGSLVKDYSLSVTHLINFLDLEYGGPMRFVERNLLRFPQAMNAASAYGSAMHMALEMLQREFKRTKEVPSLEFLYEKYERALLKQRLVKKDFVDYLEKGQNQLSIYYTEHASSLDLTDLSEYDFRSQGVKIGEAILNGKLDKMQVDKENGLIRVVDYKTGKPLQSWKDYYAKSKAWKYKLQLVFYKILVENARDFADKYRVENGAIEFLDAAQDDDIKVLEALVTEEDMQELIRLIKIVYHKIVTLDFPDVSVYSADFEGTQEFIADLLNGS